MTKNAKEEVLGLRPDVMLLPRGGESGTPGDPPMAVMTGAESTTRWIRPGLNHDLIPEPIPDVHPHVRTRGPLSIFAGGGTAHCRIGDAEPALLCSSEPCSFAHGGAPRPER